MAMSGRARSRPGFQGKENGMRSRRTSTPTRARQTGLTGPLDLIDFFGEQLIGGTLDTLEWAVEETADQAGYLARRTGERALRSLGRAIRRRHRDS